MANPISIDANLFNIAAACSAQLHQLGLKATCIRVSKDRFGLQFSFGKGWTVILERTEERTIKMKLRTPSDFENPESEFAFDDHHIEVGSKTFAAMLDAKKDWIARIH